MANQCVVRGWLVFFPHADVGIALGCESGCNISHLRELVEESVNQSGVRACIGNVVIRKGTEAPTGMIH